MSDFYNFLATAIQETASQYITSEQDHLRVVFSALPASMLEATFDVMSSSGARLTLKKEGLIKDVPVLLVQQGAEDPSHQNSTRCTSNHVVAIRTSSGSFIALLAVNDPPLLSTDTAVNKIGLFSGDHQALSSWLQEPFIEKIIEVIFERYPEMDKSEESDLKTKILKKALEEIWNDSGHDGAWILLRDLYDAGGDSGGAQKFYTTVGLPYLLDSETPEPEINKNIADFFSDHGINKGTELLQEEASDLKVIEALGAFKTSIVSHFRTPQEFNSSPILNYALASDGGQASWWAILSQTVWVDLINQTDNTEQGTLRVTCTNELYSQTVKSHPAVVSSCARFMLEPDQMLLGQEVKIFRASGRKKLEILDTVILEEGGVEWEDVSTPDEHLNFLKYEFRTDNIDKPVVVKLINLEKYNPIVTLNCRSASKLSQFKLKKTGKKSKKSFANHYECDLLTNGTGTHTVDLYYRDGICLPSTIKGYFGDDEPEVERNITVSHDSSHAVSVIEVPEDGYYEFNIDTQDSNGTIHFKINVISSEFVAKGAASEFEKLVIQNCTGSTSSVSKVDAKQTMLTGFESWLLDDEESYHPVILGPDFKDVWQPPCWGNRPKLSALELYLDPRPRVNEFTPPSEYLSSREKIRLYLKRQCEERGCPIEGLSLGQMMLENDIRKMVCEYIEHYVSWLETNPLAVWSDLLTVHKTEQSGKSLEYKPLAVLMSPLHPVRLAWQCNAQDILQDSIRQGQPCPAASIIDPSGFPDCLALPCRDVSGQYQYIGYAAVKSTTDYWSVMWRQDMIQEVDKANVEGVFGDDLGVSIEGIVNGFNKQQLKRSLNEIHQLAPAKSRLRVSLHSDSSSHSTCNEGIDEWCMENLGPEEDEWADAGGLTLQVLDARPVEEQPEPATLASLTERSGTSVRWHTKVQLEKEARRDLSIVDHLQTMHQEFRTDNVYSAVDYCCVTRLSIKKNAQDHQRYLSMSRVGKFVNPLDDNKLQKPLVQALKLLEEGCVTQSLFDSLGFAPNLVTLDESLENTRYSAISSAVVDASCFYKPDSKAYLWDYELPRYAPGSGQTSGFYLIANQSPNMLKVMKDVIGKFNDQINPEDEQVTVLLEEISKRGIPTLKRLTSGGSASLGEIGMLVATRLLQSEFQKNKRRLGLIPAVDDNKINLVIPADIFQPRFDELRTALKTKSKERPDLIVMSIAFKTVLGDELPKPVKIKITPIEVKTRSGEMNDSQRVLALGQATVFSDFLKQMKTFADKSLEIPRKAPLLWGTAYRNMLSSWLDYGFRIYGETSVAKENQHWTHYHQETLRKLMAGDLEVEIDSVGRLISIENTNKSRVISANSNNIDDTVILDYNHASSLLAGEEKDVVSTVADRVNHWGLLADSVIASEEASKTEGKEEIESKKASKTQFDESDNDDSFDNAVEISTSKKKSPEEVNVNAKGICFKIGEAPELLSDKEVMFHPGNTNLNNINIGVVGDLGTGKTQFLKSLVYQMVKHPESNRGVAPKILILDYKRDFSDLSDDNCHFIEKAGVKVVRPENLPLNLFSSNESSSSMVWLDRYSFFRDVLRKIFGVNAPVQDERLKQAVKLSYEKKNGVEKDPTIYDVFEEYKEAVDGKPDSIYGIMSDIVDYKIFEKDTSKIMTFEQFFDGVVAIDLSMFNDDKLKNMVVVIFLNLYYDYMLKIEKKPFLGKNPQTRFIDSYLLVDEAHNIMPFEFPVLSKLLLQGRAFGVGIIMASQYFSHFKTQKEDYREPIQSWFIHKVPGITSRDLDKVGLPSVGDRIIGRIASLGTFQSLCKTLGYSGEFIDGVPFYKLD